MGNGNQERANLYQAILADPDSDALRERFADWSAANGEADRAELIRLQLEDARTPDSDDPDEVWERNRERMVALIKAHPEWRSFPELPGVSWGQGSNFGFERGFLNSVLVTGSEAFKTQLGRVFEVAPVTRAVVEKVDDAGVAEIAASPFLARLRHLSLDSRRIGEAAAVALAGSPNVAGLRSLRLRRCGVGSRGAGALASSRFLSDSLDLNLRGNPIDAASAQALRDRFGEKLQVDTPEEAAR